MNPTECIADLDGELAAGGEVIRLQRLTLAAGNIQIPFEVTCRAFVRRFVAQELVGSVTQQKSRIIISPTEIERAQWTSGRPAHEDRRVPRKGNRVFVGGRARDVEAAAGLYVAGELVRIEMEVLG